MSNEKYKDFGIYKIQSKKDPSQFYIGASSFVTYRMNNHTWLLNRNKDHCTKLQNYANLNSNEWDMVLLKRCDEDHLQFWEQYYISELQPTLNTFRFSTVKSNAKNEGTQSVAVSDGAFLVTREAVVIEYCNREIIPEDLIPINY